MPENDFTTLGDEWDEVAKQEYEEWQRQEMADHASEEEELDEHEWNGPLDRSYDRGHDCEHER